MSDVTVTVPRRWLRLVRSPLMLIISALTGVSITFAPLALFQLGKEQAAFSNPRVILWFAVIYLVPAVHMALAGHVMAQLYNLPSEGKPKEGDSPLDTSPTP